MTSELTYTFGHFRLWPQRHVLVAGDLAIKLGARAFDLLVTLVGSPDRVLGKGELMEAVWPRLVVEENNLNVQIVALRKVLGHAAIATIPGRGYRFVMPVQVEGDRPADAAPQETRTLPLASSAPAAPRSTNLAGEAPTLYGRGDDIAAVLSLLVDNAVVTVTGAGGVGKTRLGEAVAYRLLGGYPDGVWWVELAAVSDPSLVAATVARTLGVDPDSARSATRQVVSALRSQRALLVLDNCEHVLDAVAALVDGVRAS
ncbi:MAG: winged helix-turn-helix domain-containing protein, partial [Caldimonas sp.]